jgi:hypothetical protein
MRRTFLAVAAILPISAFQFAASAQAKDYWVVTRTGENNGAGSDADVEIKLIGTKGETGFVVLDNPGDDREKGDADIYVLNLNDIGDVQKAVIRAREESAKPDGPQWFLDRVTVRNVSDLGIPREATLILNAPVGNIREKRRRFENAFRKLPGTKEFTVDKFIEPGKFPNRGTPNEWVEVSLPL